MTVIGTNSNPGLVPRLVRSLLAKVKAVGGTLTAGWVECYQEKLFDLRDRKANLDLMEDRNHNIVIKGLSATEFSDYSQFQKEHEAAWQSRMTAATKLNEFSSRSHFVLQLCIQIKQKDRVLHSKLYVCDLAGSEDNKRTGNVGERMKESGMINKSLFCLGQVVEALNKSSLRIPYRDSKLTRLLQDALGGSAVAVVKSLSLEPKLTQLVKVLACLAGNDYLETLNTLQFAAKCASIQNQVVVNETRIPSPKMIAPLANKRSSLEHDKENLLKKARRERISDPPQSSGLISPMLRGKGILAEDIQRRLEKVENRLLGGDFNLPNKTDLKKDSETKLLELFNTGTKSELLKLRQVGEVRAKQILAAREELGVIKSISDLKTHINKSTLEAIWRANIDIDIQI
ncbi:Kinesin-like protein kif22 [Phlyctochytrium planicorne]|nr:Kinesin-like protein kif22 [Phlyctochytrium planicorne]